MGKQVVVGVLVLLLLFGVLELASGSQRTEGTWAIVYGEVLYVDPQEKLVLLRTPLGFRTLELALDAVILRNGSPVYLASARPIYAGVYQEALCYVDEKGQVRQMILHYLVEEQEEQGERFLLRIDIFGEKTAREKL